MKQLIIIIHQIPKNHFPKNQIFFFIVSLFQQNQLYKYTHVLILPDERSPFTAKKMYDIVVQFIHKETQRRLNTKPR